MKTPRKTLFWMATATLATTVAFGFAGCKSSQDPQQAAIAQQDSSGADPADANLAPNGPYPASSSTTTQPNNQTRVMGQSTSYAPQQQAENYQDQPSNGSGYNDYPNDDAGQYADTAAYDEADQPPPPLPEYDQPAAPGPDWYWTPGYWSWGSDGYYWVPGVWVEPPYYGALWTPPYWGWYGHRYRFHHGYWGQHIGYYGGIDYGFGYIGFGYYGGYWRGHDFYYNRAVTNGGSGGFYYDRPVVYNNVHYGARPQNRVSYNGGNGGLNVQPRPQELAAAHERHTAPIAAQNQIRQAAVANRANAFSQNHGSPEHAAFARPEAAGVVAGRSAAQPGANMRPGEAVRPGAVNQSGATMHNGEMNRPGETLRSGGMMNQGQTARPGEANRSSQMMRGNTVTNPGQPANRAPIMQHNAQMPRAMQTEPAHGENRPEAMPPTRAASPQAAPRQPMMRSQPEVRQQQAPRQQFQPQAARPQQAAPRMEAPRAAPEAPRAAPQAAARPTPAAAAPRAAAPAPAPHPAGGGGHEEHR